jgi:hypothetical protein
MIEATNLKPAFEVEPEERSSSKVEPVITCPHCHKEIKLTESLAAPLVEATRLEFEAKLAQKDTEVARREAQLRAEEQSLVTARQQIDA